MNENPTPQPIESRRALLTGIGGLAAGALVAARPAHAGPLDPPAGPVTSTGKTLTEIEPRTPVNSTNTPGDATALYRITQPGAYYLTANIAGASGKHGIVITTNGVTLDLNGFELAGVVGSLDGVTSAGAFVRTCCVRNGTISGWSGSGVALVGYEHHVRDIHSRANLGSGISCGAAALIESCTAANNSAAGIVCLEAGVLAHCAAFANGNDGINAGSGSSLAECVASSNTLDGIDGGSGSTVTCCTARANSTGIRVSSRSVVTGCSASENSGSGFVAGIHGTILDSVSCSNGVDGIRLAGRSLVRGNYCWANGTTDPMGAGIHVTDGGLICRIEANTCVLNSRGFRIEYFGNILVGNMCSGSNVVNWDVAGGNKCLVVRSVSGAAMYGDSGGVGIGSTDPYANFTY